MKKNLTVILILITVLTQSCKKNKKKQDPMEDLKRGLVGYYPFNGNANDESGNGNHGTVNGAVTLTTDRNGITNSAYDFIGNSSSFINIGRPNILMLQDEISISVWFTMKNGTINPRLLQYGCGGQEFIVASIGTDNTKRDMDIGINGLVIRVPNIYALSNWNNLIYSAKRSTGLASVYLNGKLINSIKSEKVLSNINYSANFNIGRMACPSNDAWGGKIDDIAIWNRLLTATEVNKIFSRPNF
jgi:hypothetical protein